ncbi:uncharacterized protein LOC134725240 isoform X2 [Mytilus trossulus]|uniref:uncharacterized protein LOC134725240 isoform X2 n=1 Tax=Mytilus trossulus TaxID=6551 RepID=UPI003007548F
MRIPMDCFWCQIWISFIFTKYVIMETNQFEYHGCFADEGNFDVHDHGFLHRANMSAKICYHECSKGNVTRQYFATEDGSHCVCGGIIGLSTLKQRKQKENKCKTPCMSNENEMCGSKNRASVYLVKTGDSSHPEGSIHSINGITGSYNSDATKSVSVGPFHSVNARIVGGVIGAVILIIFLTLCLFKNKNRKKNGRPYTTARNGSEIQDKALLVMLSSNNPSSPGYESLQLNHTEFFEYAQTMVTEEQDLTDDEIINDHRSKQSTNGNNDVNHYESVEASNYSKFDESSLCNQLFHPSESVFNNSRFNRINRIDGLLPGANIICEVTIDNPYDTIDPDEIGFRRRKSNDSTSTLDKIIHSEYTTQMKCTCNAYGILDPKETGFYRSNFDKSINQLEQNVNGQAPTQRGSSCNTYGVLDPKETGFNKSNFYNSNSELDKSVNVGDSTLRGSTGNAYAVLDPKETRFYRSKSLDNELEKVFFGDDLNQKYHSTFIPYYTLNPVEPGYKRSELDNCKRGCSEKTQRDTPNISVDNRIEDFTQNAYSVLDSRDTGFIRGHVTAQMNEAFKINNEN